MSEIADGGCWAKRKVSTDSASEFDAGSNLRTGCISNRQLAGLIVHVSSSLLARTLARDRTRLDARTSRRLDRVLDDAPGIVRAYSDGSSRATLRLARTSFGAGALRSTECPAPMLSGTPVATAGPDRAVVRGTTRSRAPRAPSATPPTDAASARRPPSS
jgi:hypothetical protein